MKTKDQTLRALYKRAHRAIRTHGADCLRHAHDLRDASWQALAATADARTSTSDHLAARADLATRWSARRAFLLTTHVPHQLPLRRDA